MIQPEFQSHRSISSADEWFKCFMCTYVDVAPMLVTRPELFEQFFISRPRRLYMNLVTIGRVAFKKIFEFSEIRRPKPKVKRCP